MHRLKVSAQSYAWGKQGKSSKVAQLAAADPDFNVDESKTYAELWMGTHPNGPSSLFNDPSKSLKSILTEKGLTRSIHERYAGDIPFLFKVLSINVALSIQAHPDKALAQRLFKEHPNIYKDPNHKPEMAVALTPFEAFIGFRPLSEIASHLEKYPEFAALFTAGVKENFIKAAKGGSDDAAKKAALKALFKELMECPASKIESGLSSLVGRLKGKQHAQGTIDELVCRLDSQFPKDVGTYCAFLLNYVKLQPGDGIFLAANEPHAYLSGDLIECMAASDNVVRSGLTPKFKDVPTLVSMLTYAHGPADAQILRGDAFQSLTHSKLYDPPIDEFSILRTDLPAGAKEEVKGLDGPSIVVVTGGKGTFGAGGKPVEAAEGFVFYVDAGVAVGMTADKGTGLTAYRAFCVAN
ncbi:Mannose-6-phosphate isomerase [Irineochytrium annulatum]|nr:Mannose-6-phosphate isomerase [Irineochytrium annulatum]